MVQELRTAVERWQPLVAVVKAAWCDAVVDDAPGLSPLLTAGKDYAAASVFEPAGLLREARRQKRLADVAVPTVCLLDPDGDIVDYLAGTGCGCCGKSLIMGA